MLTFSRILSALFLFLGAISLSFAQGVSGDDMRSLDGQVQEIKSDVLNIAAELNALEEQLLYPSSTQFAVFISIASNEMFRLDAVQIEIDGELATHHIYSFKELEALRKGGVQRVYTGNTTTGAHQLRVTMMGQSRSGKDFSESNSFEFIKGIEPGALEISLAGSGSSGIRFGEL